MAITQIRAHGTWYTDPQRQRSAADAPAWAKREWKRRQFQAVQYAMRQAGDVDNLECVAIDANGTTLGLLLEP